MNAQPPPFLFLGKCLQTPKQEPALIWPVKKAASFFVVAAHPRKFGVFLTQEKPGNATAAANLAAVCRTWGETLAVKAIWFDAASRSWWIPVGSDLENPKAYVHLIGGNAPEISLIEFEGAGEDETAARRPFVRMRMGTAGIFTKRRDFGGVLPHQLDAETRAATFRDVLPDLVMPSEEKAKEKPVAEMLPLYQREARDRIARRVKTLRKSLVQQEGRLPSEEDITSARQLAIGLQEQVANAPGATGAGKAIDEAFQALKKKEQGRRQAMVQVDAGRKVLEAAEEALGKLRGAPMPEDEVRRLLSVVGLAKATKTQTSERGKAPVAMDWMTFRAGEGILLRVGKGAAENDRLVKASAANDWWIHAVGVTGSHVLVPARQLKGASELPANIMRAAGILALHYSKNRANKAGEVYLTRRANLRKRKGDPPGLWQIDRSSSVMIRYTDDELSAVLSGSQG